MPGGMTGVIGAIFLGRLAKSLRPAKLGDGQLAR
jgi:hypothetical protein